jgi:O-antigen/teichoic acid export membrane protein
MDAVRRGMLMRMFSSALTSQVLLSGASFAVALLLIRLTSDLQYGYFILVVGAIMLAVSLQNSFIAPVMINRMTRLSPRECGDLTGGIYREQWRVIAAAAGLALAATLTLWLLGTIDGPHALLTVAAVVGATMALRREFFRMVLLAYRRAHDVLRGDVVYIALLVPGVLLATSSRQPAAAAALALALAALVASLLLSRTLRRAEAWNTRGAPGILREIAPLGRWSTAGAAIHWSFNQGYTFLVAATLDVSAVAAVAATRLLAMPVNLLTTGIGSLMLPLVARWLHDSGASVVLRRLFWFALVIATAATCYFVVLWILRDWVFAVVLGKQFAQGDTLLLLWSAVFVLMAVNQQLLWLLVARQRFHRLTSLGAVSAVVGLSCSYWGMLHFGGAGAPLGILVGETVSCAGLALLCLREVAPAARARPLPAEVAS